MGNKGAANRCKWVNLKNPAYIRYHDTEWGVPQHKDEVLFEMLFLEWFQAGLSWECILNKREGFRRAFDGFDAEKNQPIRRRRARPAAGRPRHCPQQAENTGQHRKQPCVSENSAGIRHL